MARARLPQVSVPARANRILNIILCVMLVILVRLWHLTVVQHEDKLADAKRPQRRICIERPERGTIRDRFNLPLAVNKMQYNAAVSYAQLNEVPRVSWEQGVRRYTRREHIRKLAELLAEELDLSADRIEDQIHSKAALFPNSPFIVKEGISEAAYYRLRMLEKDYIGLHTERVGRRFYPQERVGADVLGYLGQISREELEKIATEKQELEAILEEENPPPKHVLRRYYEVQERSYALNDLVGKSGLEGAFDEQLRGFCGTRTYQQDIYGTYVKELPGGRAPVPGQRLVLTLSAQLQQFAEQLLIQSESIREGRSRVFDFEKRTYTPLKQPWI